MSAKTNKLKRRIKDNENAIKKLEAALSLSRRSHVAANEALLSLRKEKERGFKADGSIVLSVRKESVFAGRSEPHYVVAIRLSPEMLFHECHWSRPGTATDYTYVLKNIALEMERKVFRALVDYFDEKMGFKQKVAP